MAEMRRSMWQCGVYVPPAESQTMPAKKRKAAQTLIRPARADSPFPVLTKMKPDIHAPMRALWALTLKALWPWDKRRYPGFMRVAGDALGFDPGTIARWKYPGSGAISAWTARRIIAILDARISEAQHLRQQWQAYELERLVIETKPSTGPGRRKKIKALDTTPPSA